MEHYLSLFMKSVFVENLGARLLPGNVHVPGGLQERQDRTRTGRRGDRDSNDYHSGEQLDLSTLVARRVHSTKASI